MKNLILAALLAAATASSQISISRVVAVPPDVAQKQAAFAQTLAPSAQAKIQTIATTMLASGAPQDETGLATTVGTQVTAMFPGIQPQAQPNDTLTFLVLSEMTNQQQNELKTITAEMQKISKQKTELRTRIAKAASKEKASPQPPRIATVAAVPPAVVPAPPPLPQTATLAEMRQRYDDLSTMSDANQRRMQMVQDTLQKYYGFLSNALKRMDDTANAVVSSLK